MNMKMGKQVLYVFITAINIVIIGIFIGKDMITTDNPIIQAIFENKYITEESIDIHAQSQCLDDFEIKAMQVDAQPKVDNVAELDFSVIENQDYVVKVCYESLMRQEELIETLTKTVNSIENKRNNISMLTDKIDVTPTPDIITTLDGYTFDKSIGKT